jgi:hypothetical protein
MNRRGALAKERFTSHPESILDEDIDPMIATPRKRQKDVCPMLVRIAIKCQNVALGIWR